MSDGSFAILITGLPASGKTTLGKQISSALGLPLLSRDCIKEAIYDSIDPRDTVSARTLGAASANVLWSLISECPSGVIIDTWIDPTRNDSTLVKAALQKAGVQVTYEILCKVPGHVAAKRYANRQRSTAHRSDAQVLQHIKEVADLIKPLGFGPSLVVDTSSPIDVGPILLWCRTFSGKNALPAKIAN